MKAHEALAASENAAKDKAISVYAKIMREVADASDIGHVMIAIHEDKGLLKNDLFRKELTNLGKEDGYRIFIYPDNHAIEVYWNVEHEFLTEDTID